MEVWGGSRAANTRLRRPGLDAWIRSVGTQRVEAGGGELHLLSSCASGRITRFLLADICGIDSSFSEVACELRDLMKSNVNTIRQERIVHDVSKRLDEAASQGTCASLLIGTYFAPTQTFHLCNTGHPPPFVFRASDSTWSVLKETPQVVSTSTPPVGSVVLDEYQRTESKLRFGDMVLSYSNAFTECRDAAGNILGVSGLLRRVQSLATSDPSSILSTLYDQLQSDHEENERIQEATLLLCQATDTKVGLRNNVLAPFRLLKAVSDNTKID